MASSNGLTTTAQQPGLTSDFLPFASNGGNVRVAVINGDPWFHAGDVCKVVGIVNVTDALTRLDEDERSTLASSKGGPSRNIVSESGFYTLVMTSRKPEAKLFRRWVTSEVIPAIRKTGKYSLQPRSLTAEERLVAQAQLSQDRIHLSREQAQLSSHRIVLGLEKDYRIEAILQQQVTMAAKLDEITRLIRPTAYAQRDLELDERYQWFDRTASLLGTGGTRLRKFLRQQGVLSSDPGSWNKATSVYKDKGYFDDIWSTSSFTPKGRKWIHDLASRGWLDAILDHDALISRISTWVDLSQPITGLMEQFP